MSADLVPRRPGTPAAAGLALPPLIHAAGPKASRRFLEFFAAQIRNPNTRAAYARAVGQFLAWCEDRGLAELRQIEPLAVAAYIEGHPGATPTVKQHLAAIRMLFDWLVTGQVLPTNPAAAVRGPKHVVKRGKTPVLAGDEARQLLEAIDVSEIGGLRDRALLGLMVYSFARVSAALAMNLEDYYPEQKRWWFRLHEKGGKRHEVPAHHTAEEYMDAYLEAAEACGLDRSDGQAPIFRTLEGQWRSRRLSSRRLNRREAVAMVKRRARQAGLPPALASRIGNHTFRATGITAYLNNGGSLEHAQQIAAHESPRTTKLYDRTNDELTLDEIERIQL